MEANMFFDNSCTNLNNKKMFTFRSNNLPNNGQDKIVSFLKSSNIRALRIINNNSYSGSTLENLENEQFIKLKNMGIKSIVDLRENGDKNYVNKCTNAKIEYFKFPLDFIFNQGKSDIFVGKNRSVVNDNFIDKLKNFLCITKDGNMYMGCQQGLDRTNFAIILNYLFNFNSNDKTPQILSSDIGTNRTLLNRDLDLIRKIINKMTSEQKMRLNMPKNFNEILLERIKKLVRRNR